jgi:hypothetical protein
VVGLPQVRQRQRGSLSPGGMVTGIIASNVFFIHFDRLEQKFSTTF